MGNVNLSHFPIRKANKLEHISAFVLIYFKKMHYCNFFCGML